MKYESLTKLHNILIGKHGGTKGMFLAFFKMKTLVSRQSWVAKLVIS